MDPNTIQLVGTVLLIAVAAAVALVCDYLRNKPQPWPEMAVAVNRGSDLATPSPLARVAAPRKDMPVSAEPPPMPTLGRVRQRPVPPADMRLPRLEDMDHRQAFAEWLDRRAAKLSEKTIQEEAVPQIHAGQVFLPTAPEAKAISLPVTAEIEAVLRQAIVKRYEADVIEPAEEALVANIPSADTPESAPVAALMLTGIAPAARSVNIFLSTRKIEGFGPIAPVESKSSSRETFVDEEAMQAMVESLALVKSRFEVIEGAGSSEVMLPPGMHERVILNRAIASGKPFRGLVVSIGVNDLDGGSAQNVDLLKSIGSFIRSLLNGREFACCSGDAEFLIVCPTLEGADAHRRLIQVAEQLWDYQLRGIGTRSIVFSWGGADVHHQPLSEAVAMANEQMSDTRRGRRLFSNGAGSLSRKAAV